MTSTASVLHNRLLARCKFRHVQVLLTVAELGTLQRAADAIGITQPSLTQTLAYLEDLLDVKLFDRHARGMRPTPACRDLLPMARQLMLGLSLSAEAVVARQQRGQSTVRLVASQAATHGLLVEALPLLVKRFDGITVYLTEAEGEDQLLAIARGEADVVACRRPSVIPEGWGFEPLVEDRFTVLCRPQHPLASTRDVSWSDLAEQTWVVSPVGVPGRKRFDALAAEFPHPVRTYPVITRSMLMLRWLLRHEDVLAYLPYALVRPLIDAGEMAEVAIRHHVPIEPLGLLRPNDGVPAAAQTLIDFLHQRSLQ